MRCDQGRAFFPAPVKPPPCVRCSESPSSIRCHGAASVASNADSRIAMTPADTLTVRRALSGENDRAAWLFRDSPLPAGATFLVAVRAVPRERFVAACALWTGTPGRFRLAFQPGIAPETVAPALLDACLGVALWEGRAWCACIGSRRIECLPPGAAFRWAGTGRRRFIRWSSGLRSWMPPSSGIAGIRRSVLIRAFPHSFSKTGN